MGVLNATPDSFSDGGRYHQLDAALAQGRALIAAGADILDVGGESTRPGSRPPDEEEELRRTIPLIEALRAETDTPVSIDTRRPGVARAAVRAGAAIWNDVSGLSERGALETAASLNCGVVITHMRGDPATMQVAPRYGDVVDEVLDALNARAAAALAAGVPEDGIYIDPGVGFGKTLAHNLELLRALDRFAAGRWPVVLGASRKSFILGLDPGAVDPLDRLGGSIAVALAGARAGCRIVRVHDVRETAQALKVDAAIGAPRPVRGAPHAPPARRSRVRPARG